MGLATKNIFNAILLLKLLFSCIFRSIAFISFYICCKMVKLGFGGRLRGIKSKLLINKIIKMHIRCKMGRFRLGGRLRRLQI